MVQDISKSEAELQFRYQLEEGQVEITSEPYGQKHIRGLELQQVIASFRHIECRHKAPHQLRAEIAAPLCCKLELYRGHHIGRLDILTLNSAALHIMEPYIAVAKHHARREPDTEIVIQPH